MMIRTVEAVMVGALLTVSTAAVGESGSSDDFWQPSTPSAMFVEDLIPKPAHTPQWGSATQSSCRHVELGAPARPASLEYKWRWQGAGSQQVAEDSSLTLGSWQLEYYTVQFSTDETPPICKDRVPLNQDS